MVVVVVDSALHNVSIEPRVLNSRYLKRCVFNVFFEIIEVDSRAGYSRPSDQKQTAADDRRYCDDILHVSLTKVVCG